MPALRIANPQQERIGCCCRKPSWEGEAPAEPRLCARNGSAGASPSLSGGFRNKNELATRWLAESYPARAWHGRS